MNSIAEKKVQHTPGPWDWFIGKRGNKEPSREPQMRNFIGSNGQGFATTVGLHREQDEANARLIAAAPEMYEALRVLTEQIRSTFENPSTTANFPGKLRERVIAAERILAQVEGKE